MIQELWWSGHLVVCWVFGSWVTAADGFSGHVVCMYALFRLSHILCRYHPYTDVNTRCLFCCRGQSGMCVFVCVEGLVCLLPARPPQTSVLLQDWQKTARFNMNVNLNSYFVTWFRHCQFPPYSAKQAVIILYSLQAHKWKSLFLFECHIIFIG